MARYVSSLGSALQNTSYPSTGPSGSVAVWLRPHWSSGDGTFHVFWSFAADGSHESPAFERFTDNNIYCGFTGFAAGEQRIIIADTGLFTSGTWAHWVFTWTNGGTHFLYKNGVQVGSRATSTANGQAGFLTLGDYVTLSGLVNTNTELAQFAYWNNVITADDIAYLAAGGSADHVQTGSRVSYYPLLGTTSPEPDSYSSLSLTIVGTATQTSDPPALWYESHPPDVDAGPTNLGTPIGQQVYWDYLYVSSVGFVPPAVPSPAFFEAPYFTGPPRLDAPLLFNPFQEGLIVGSVAAAPAAATPIFLPPDVNIGPPIQGAPFFEILTPVIFSQGPAGSSQPPQPPYPPKGSSRSKPFLERVPDIKGATSEDRLRRFTEKLSAMVNSLASQGYIYFSGQNTDGSLKYGVLNGCTVATRNPLATDDSSTAIPQGSIWINSSTPAAFLCLSNVANGAIWVPVNTAAVPGTVTSIALTPPAAGITVTGSPITTSGTFALALANDLAALEALAGTSTIYYRSGVDTWTAVTIGTNLGFSAGTLGSSLGTAATHATGDFALSTTTVNGHALTANVTVTATDVGLGSVTNDAQTKAAIVPNTAPSAGQILAGNAGGTAYAPVTVSGSGATITLASTGIVTISAIAAASLAQTYRQQLTATTTYFVRTDGSDSNTGLVNSAGGAFLTIQKAVNVVSALDNGGFNVTISVATGTYTGAINLLQYVGSGSVTIQGDTTTPTNVVLSTTSNNTITATAVTSPYTITGFQLKTTTSGDCIHATNGSVIFIQKINFGACAGSHILAFTSAAVALQNSYTIAGAAAQHWDTQRFGSVTAESITITVSGTPAFTTFAISTLMGLIAADGSTFSGSATGTRYFADGNGVIYTGGGGATFLPGNVAGSVSNGGVYE